MAESMWVYWLFFAVCMYRDPSGVLAVHQTAYASTYALRTNVAGLVL